MRSTMGGIGIALQRMYRAALLDRKLYEEVAANTGITRQAYVVVFLVTLATGIGTLDDTGAQQLPFVVIFGMAAWIVWVTFTYFIGTRLLDEPETDANWTATARALAFAQTPGLFRALGLIPYAGVWILVLAYAWILVAMVVAVQQAFDYTSRWRAAGVTLIGFVSFLFIFLGLILLIENT